MSSARIIPWPKSPVPAPSPTPPPSADQESTERARKRTELWVRESRFIAISYGINGLCLALFAIVGTVHWSAPLLYAVPGWIVCAVACAMIASGRTADWPEPSMATAQSIAGLGLSVMGAALFPKVGFFYILVLFTVFLSATYRTDKVRINIAWAVTSLLVAVALLWGDRQFDIPSSSAAEQAIAWLCFSLTLARCTLLSVINTGYNALLRQRSQQMKDTLAQIERMASHDELTGVLNRRSLMGLIDTEIAQAERTGQSFSVALLDLDRFKLINDTLGHLTGDRVLRRFAETLQAHRRNTDRFGRHGGEEFLLLMPDTASDEASLAVERLRARLAETDCTDIAPDMNVTFSAGLASHRPGGTAEQLLACADRGLYGAKHAGRNCLRAG